MSTPPFNSGLTNDTTKPTVSKSAQEIADFLKETPEEKKITDDKEDKKIKDDREDNLEEEDDDIKLKEDEDEEEEKLDLDEKEEDEDKDKKKKVAKGEDEDDEIEIEAPPRKKEITTKYPTFFKDFPWMEKMMYRDKQYTELFGSFDDAREIAESAEVLQDFERDLMQGDTTKVLAKIKEIDSKAFDKLVDDYLPNLAKVDKDAYFEVVGNIGRHIVKDIASEAIKRQNAGDKDTSQTLKSMANLLNQFLFGTTEFEEPKVRAQKDEKTDELEQERMQFVKERFETVRDDLQGKVDKILRATIADYIDPKGEMSSYEKRNAIRDCLLDVHRSVREDTGFVKSLDRLWDAVFSTRFSNDSQSRVQKAYLGKSRSVLKAAIKRARAEALKDTTRRERVVKDDDDNDRNERERETSSRRRTPETGRPHQERGNKMQRKPGESVLEFLSRD